jgi:OmpA-OmpF porin, OOP family
MVFRLSLRPLLVLCLASALAHAQADLRAQLFGEAEKAMHSARDAQADLYAPKSFSKGQDAYTEADDYFKRGKAIDKIQDRLRDAVTFFARSTESAKLGEKTFQQTMVARNDALKVEAPVLYSEAWRGAESSFRSAAIDLEDGNLSDARKEGAEAEGLYRKAELESIRAKLLNPARALIKEADATDVRDGAPRTLDRAKKLAADTEVRLAQNRYNNTGAAQLALDARYEASHAIYLHRTVALMKKQDRTFEDIIVASEEPLRQIAEAVHVRAEFDSGYGPTTQRILATLQGPDTATTRLAATVRRQDSIISVLNARLAAGGKGGVGPGTPGTLDQSGKLQDILSQVQPMFANGEATILVTGNNAVLRLTGVSFALGTNVLDPSSRLLLSRVDQAIRKFPGCQVSIEGHTEAIGSEIANQRNSEERAGAVASYLRSLLPSTIAVTSTGYGGSRPIGPGGKNKRIEVVIVPEWAIIGK